MFLVYVSHGLLDSIEAVVAIKDNEAADCMEQTHSISTRTPAKKCSITMLSDYMYLHVTTRYSSYGVPAFSNPSYGSGLLGIFPLL
jgi:hypothetical protein